MIATWVDADNTLSGTTLVAAKIYGALRYVGIGTGPKRMTVAERNDLTAHSITVFGIAESTVTEADNGYNAGVRDAQAVLADPASVGLQYIFAVNDKPTYIQSDVDYVRGFASVLGTRASAYGFASFLVAVRTQTPVSLYWQAGLPPNMTGTQSFVHFWQRQGTSGNGSDGPANPTTAVIGGVTCDLNNQLLEVVVTQPADIWSYAIPNPLFDSTVTDSADVRSHKAYTAAQFLVGDWRNDLQTQQTVSANQVALLSALKTLPTGGQVDVPTLVAALAAPLEAALAPLLPQGVTAAQMAHELGAALDAAK
jgi:hypothetical protein